MRPSTTSAACVSAASSRFGSSGRAAGRGVCLPTAAVVEAPARALLDRSRDAGLLFAGARRAVQCGVGFGLHYVAARTLPGQMLCRAVNAEQPVAEAGEA